jgi:hypothetical protein
MACPGSDLLLNECMANFHKKRKPIFVHVNKTPCEGFQIWILIDFATKCCAVFLPDLKQFRKEQYENNSGNFAGFVVNTIEIHRHVAQCVM